MTTVNQTPDAHTTGARSVTRRNLTRGALWAVPVIAASTAVPAFAASADDCKTVHGPDFTQVGGWMITNPASGALQSRTKNKPVTAPVTGQAWWSMESATSPNPATIRLMSVYEATHGPEGDLNLNCGEFVMTYNVSALEATGGTTHLHPSMDIYFFSPEGEIIDRQVFTTDPTGKATVMTRSGKTQTVQGQVIPFASSVNDQATGISARFALRGDKLMEGMYQFEVVITVPTIRENGKLDTSKQVNAIAFTPPTFNMVS
ncbi:ornithinee aminotransferase [Rothia mucilaginosa]|uniref:ornithinee aminotransferase n=1 Tax=Rothia mucilaginosa TaxID=43675 RepID=UPI0026EB10C9|nr:ornithinee aminotransferase [Rothia mucilaginosa]